MRWWIPITVSSLLIFGSAFAGECPVGAIPGFPKDFTADCYLYERFPTQYVTAERLCRLSGGNLASVYDDFVNAFIARKLYLFRNNYIFFLFLEGGVEAFLIMQRKSFWIGANNLHNASNFEWVDDSKWGYTRWDERKKNQFN